LAIFSILFVGCGTYKYVPENQYLLNDVKIKMENKSALKGELFEKVFQKPNKRVLGFRFHMFLYNRSNPDKDKGIHNYLRKIGEEPVVWNSYQTKRSTEQLKKVMEFNGYFRAQVKDTVKYRGKRKVEVEYFIKPGKAYRILDVNYNIQDPKIEALVKSDSMNIALKLGDRYRVADLVREKKRVVNRLVNAGYYDFINEDINNYITYRVDTSLNRNVGVSMFISNPDSHEGDGRHYKYRINNVYIFRNYQTREYLNNPDYMKTGIDTLIYDSIYFLSKGETVTNPGILSQSNYILPGELYRFQNEYLTMKHLRSLRIFKNVEINLRELEDSIVVNNEKLLNCYINLSPLNRKFIQFDIAATNSAFSGDSTDKKTVFGNIGAEASVKYQYKNLFGNAEILDVTVRGAAESLFLERDETRINSKSIGVETRLHIPKFLIPFKTENFIKKYSPQTSTALSYKYSNRPDFYERNIAKLSFGYNWKGNRYTRHTVDPINLNFVQADTSSRFHELFINRSRMLFEDFQDKMISSFNYSFEYNNDLGSSKDFIYFKYNIEFGGNLLRGIYRAFDDEVLDDEVYKFGRIPFSQFTKTDFDLRYYDYRSQSQTIVYRLYMGVAVPYGNSVSIPYEKKYFIGGPNSIRAWEPFTLGPGKNYNDPLVRNRFSASSDVKLEFNIEYRFDIFWKLEGALFLDGGNIWSMRKEWDEDDQILKEKAKFEWNGLEKEIALGTGFGTRLVFDYFIIRLDWGLKLHNPSGFRYGENNENVSGRWIFDKSGIGRNDYAFQLGVTYPF